MAGEITAKTKSDLNKEFAFRNAQLPVDERVRLLISVMTLQEKVAQTLCIWQQKYDYLIDEKGELDKSKIEAHLKHGIGQVGRISDTGKGLSAKEMAEFANKIQKHFCEETRLGIPVIIHEECLHGLMAKEATSYPQPIGLAATFNPHLIEKIYTAIAEDTRVRGAHHALTPVLDVARDPRWGRVEETFGEDPYLVSELGIAAVRGFQGDATFKNRNRVIATLKHFAAHGQPESGMNCGPVNVSERVLRDTFLYPFKVAVQKANACSVMASYNEIDGISSHANKWLLKKVLREEWGFDGTVVSDYYAITELNVREEAISHCMAGNKAEAALLAANAGVNVELPELACYPHLLELVQSGTLKEAVLDELIYPTLKHKFQLGLFEDPYVDPNAIDSDKKLETDRPLALEAALETITLLKNEGDILPLDPQSKETLAVIGPNADRDMLGGYSGTPKYCSTVLQGIKERVGNSANVLYSEGCKITLGGSWFEDEVVFPDPADDRAMIRDAVKVAEKADKVIMVLGGNEQTSREGWAKNHMGDRADLELFGSQNDLLRAVLATGKPVVVLLINGRPLSFNVVNNNVPAILECWYLGQETGEAAAKVLFGDYNPAGKLPISIPRSVGHIPCFYNYKPSARRGYLKDDVTPLYPFGYGLSYTSFEVSDVKLSKTAIARNENVTVTAKVKNTGKRTGQEVVQLYIRDKVSSVTRPVKELKGFKKVAVEPGELKAVELELTPEHLAFTNIDMEFTVEPGDFDIMVGTSSRDEDLIKINLTVKNTEV